MTTWTPKTQQSETWTSEASEQRVFSRDVFSHYPVFDTGSVAGTWTEEARQSETWAGKTEQTSTWTEKTEQAETWTSV